MDKTAYSKYGKGPLWFIAVLLAIALAWLAVKYVSPSPPRTVLMSSGAPEGAYHQFALRYQQLLKAEGITLALETSAGSVENLKRLNDGEVSVAFVQGGLGFLSLDPQGDAEDSPLRSLAVIGYEPIWIFSRTSGLSAGLGPLAGKRIAVGAEGGGTRKVAIELLAAYGLDASRVTLLPDSGMAAAARLEAGEIDAVIMIAAPQAAAVQKMLSSPGLTLAALDHAEGLARRFPYLAPIVLKRGSVDPARNLPPQDLTLLATTANLVIREELHPAIAYLLLDAARQTHRQPTLFSRPGDFPSPKGTDFPLASEATRYFSDGRPFLQRYLPFWVANFVQRLLLLLIPLVAILFPLFRFLPALVLFFEKKKLYPYYEQLRVLERELEHEKPGPEQLAAMRQRLQMIDTRINGTRFSRDFSDRVYTLRQHVAFVRDLLERHAP